MVDFWNVYIVVVFKILKDWAWTARGGYGWEQNQNQLRSSNIWRMNRTKHRLEKPLTMIFPIETIVFFALIFRCKMLVQKYVQCERDILQPYTYSKYSSFVTISDLGTHLSHYLSDIFWFNQLWKMLQQKLLSLFFNFSIVLVVLVAFSWHATVTFITDWIIYSASRLLLCLLGCVHGFSPVMVLTGDGVGDVLIKRNTYTYTYLFIHNSTWFY